MPKIYSGPESNKLLTKLIHYNLKNVDYNPTPQNSQ